MRELNWLRIDNLDWDMKKYIYVNEYNSFLSILINIIIIVIIINIIVNIIMKMNILLLGLCLNLVLINCSVDENLRYINY